MEFNEFHDFRNSGVEQFNFHGCHDSDMKIYEFHDFCNSNME